MAWFEDLSFCAYFGADAATALRAVGWLESGRAFTTGSVPRPVFDKLLELRTNPWQPMVAVGIHNCDLCLYDGEAGLTNLFIPGAGFIYVCPELIVHYMNAHAYAPPEEFCRAVLACPPMRSVNYLKALLTNGGRALLHSVEV